MSVVYHYVFSQALPLGEIEAVLLRTLIATEYLHGPSRVRLEAGHYLDTEELTCVVDAATPVGEDLNKLLVGSLATEFGPDAFTVERISKAPERMGS